MSSENTKPSDDSVNVVPRFTRQDNLTQECKDFIATLPTGPAWLTSQLYQYQGFWYMARHLQGVLNCQNNFQAHDSDVLLVTSPKSGTTWLKALAFAVLNRKTYNPKLYPDLNKTHPLLTTNPHDLVPYLELYLFVEKSNPDLTMFPSPRLFASHQPCISLPESIKQSRCKIVYLCRNPEDQFVSWWHFANKLKPESSPPNSIEDMFNNFCQGAIPFGPFWDHMLGYYKWSLERPEKVMFLRFEELKREAKKVLKELAEFIGCGFSEEEESGGFVDDILKLCSFENLSNLEVNKSGKMSHGIDSNAFFRRGNVGEGRNFLTLEMIERLNRITGEVGGTWIEILDQFVQYS